MTHSTVPTEQLVKQYRDDRKLSARIALHQRFSTNPRGGSSWSLEQRVESRSERDDVDLLEVGCGRATLWQPYFSE